MSTTSTTRPVSAEEFRDWYTACEQTFANDPTDEELDLESTVFEAERSLATFDGDRIVATAGAFSLDLSVPGGSRPVAGVTMVSVAPTHRRRGIASDLMRRQLHEVHERGAEAVAALWASEPSIYGRFGYGLASWVASVEIPTRTARLRDIAGGEQHCVRPVVAADVGSLAGHVHEDVRARRGGMLRRDERWWRRRLWDPEHRRGGASALRAVVVDGPDEVEGYALYAAKSDWQVGGAEHSLNVRELLATTPAAERALWHFLLSHDLVGSLSAWGLPADTPLLHLLLDPRRAGFRLSDNLWVRLVDVRRALAERTYSADGRVVLEVVDELCPWNAGRLAVAVSGGAAEVLPTTDDADVTLAVDALGATYLGGTTFGALAAAGRFTARESSVVKTLDSMFRAAQAPFCPEVF